VADPGSNTEYAARVVFVPDYESTTVGRTRPGVATFWLSPDDHDQDPLDLKRRAAQDQRRLRELVESLGCRWESVGRIFVPSLSTSGETLTIEESMTLRARTENAGHVGDEYEWSQGC